MAAIRPRDLLSDCLLGSLGQPGALARDITRLAEVGYLNVALPPEFGGLGCTLRQAACGQRRLARHAPDTALAVSAHLYWTGAAADAFRAGDDSVRWILLEAARGALFAGGHGEAGGDLQFADPRSRCEPSDHSGYRFRDPGVLSTRTPAWDWVAVHAVHAAGHPRSVIAFAGRATRCTPAFRVARVSPAGAPADVFTASALTWGHSILASVRYSDARRAFNDAITHCAEAATPATFAAPPLPGASSGGNPLAGAGRSGGTPGSPAIPPASRAPASGAVSAPAAEGTAAAPAGDGVPPAFAGPPASRAPADDVGTGTPASAVNGRPADRWPLAEASVLLDEMKAKIAEITHPWQLVQTPLPDLGGQHLISLYAMRHAIAEGATTVHALVDQLTAASPSTRPAPR